ncbi:MAG TPA: helix-turn-helix transcriptional regulator [Anaerolineales bacterium]|nr:helix-turn-helix transcriptional regulator [Anaerolineales bacterium]
MSQEQSIRIRSKIVGVLLRDARLAAGKSMKDVGQVIGVSSSTISSIEQGSNSPSLPELELLAFYLHMPISHFWSEDIVSEEPEPARNLETERLLALRHRTIGSMLRQARAEKSLSQKDLAQRTDISTSRIRRYESGETPVPLPELGLLAASLGYEFEDFTDTSGPVGEWIATQRAEQELGGLPRSLKDFIADPQSRSYLELAQRLSEISTEKLRALAKALTDLLD